MNFRITYKVAGRTGNNIFQYLACKMICYLIGRHNYVHIKSFSMASIFNDDTWEALTISEEPFTDPIFEPLRRANIYCEGFFQDTRLFVKHRDIVLDIINNLGPNEKMPDNNCNMRSLSKFMSYQSPIYFNESDIVLSLRLDDFYKSDATDGKSMVIPFKFYCDLLRTLDFDRLYIVCDKIRHKWEQKYLDAFEEFDPILLIGGSLEQDSAYMRDATRLIHSNSTLCWINSYLTPTFRPKKERHIIQLINDDVNRMGIIDPETDILHCVNPMTHAEIDELNL